MSDEATQGEKGYTREPFEAVGWSLFQSIQLCEFLAGKATSAGREDAAQFYAGVQDKLQVVLRETGGDLSRLDEPGVVLGVGPNPDERLPLWPHWPPWW